MTKGMSLMSARRLAVIVAVSLCPLAAGLAVGAPAAFAQACPNEASRGGASAELPDCRAYEMVTPADKSSISQDMTFTNSNNEEVIAAADGNKIALDTTIEGLGPTPASLHSFVVFARTPNGWKTESFAPSNLGGSELGLGYGDDAFTPDLSEAAFWTEDIDLFPTSPDRTYYAGPPNGPFRTLAEPINEEHEWRSIRGATADFSSVFIDSQDHTLAGPESGTNPEAQDIYRWESNGKVSMVDAYENGSPVSLCGAEFKAVSEDGSNTFFTAPAPVTQAEYILRQPGCEEPRRLYMRVGSAIVDISEPETGVVDPTGFHEVNFKAASANGAKVFFTTRTELTKGDEGNHQWALYEYNTETSTLTDISRSTMSPVEPGPSTVVVSQDGSRVYYVAGGADTLYRYNTETKETREIAQVGVIGTDVGFTTDVEGNNDGLEGLRVTPDGKTAVFYDQDGINGIEPEPGAGGNDFQVYRYDDESGELACISCLPADAPRDKATEHGEAWFETPNILTWDKTPPYTVVSNDGSYVFFESTAQLVPRAVNVTGGHIGDVSPSDEGVRADVYEWHNGVISLISSPTDTYTQKLLGASEDGRNVFFVSHSQLVPQDIDNMGDIYDARIGGGFPPSVDSAACQGDTCVHPPPELNDPTPGSLSFSGPGNPPVKVLEPKAGATPKPKRCAKGKVRKGGKCLRKRRKAQRAIRRHGARKAARRGATSDRGGLR